MDQVKFGSQLIERLLEHLRTRLDGCEGAGLTVWTPDGPQGMLMAVGKARERDDSARIEPERLVCDEDGFVAVPGPIVLTVYLDHPPDARDLKVIEEIEPMLTTAAAVVEFCAGEVLRADQMVAMVRSRRLIEQAKGLVMAATQRPAGEAFALLVKASQHFNVKLSDLSTALIHHVCGTLDETDAKPSEDAARVAHQVWAAITHD